MQMAFHDIVTAILWPLFVVIVALRYSPHRMPSLLQHSLKWPTTWSGRSRPRLTQRPCCSIRFNDWWTMYYHINDNITLVPMFSFCRWVKDVYLQLCFWSLLNLPPSRASASNSFQSFGRSLSTRSYFRGTAGYGSSTKLHMPHMKSIGCTIWLFNIAMENPL